MEKEKITFTFKNMPETKKNCTINNIIYRDGDYVKVSKHYAGYKSQHPFLYGIVYFNEKGICKVRLLIPPNDIEQKNTETDINCWTQIEKI